MLGIVAGPGLSRADDDESPLGKIMEKVNKHNSTITKGTRNKVDFRQIPEGRREKRQGAGQARQGGQADQGRRQEGQGRRRPAEEVGRVHRRAHQDLREAGRGGRASRTPRIRTPRDAFADVKKVCADCHKDFRVDDGNF